MLFVVMYMLYMHFTLYLSAFSIEQAKLYSEILVKYHPYIAEIMAVFASTCSVSHAALACSMKQRTRNFFLTHP